MPPMKGPRRPAKRKLAPRKTVKRKKPIVSKPRAVPDWTAEDAAVFDAPKPPAGFAYQWSPVSSIFRMQLKGWVQVPFSRHSSELAPSCNFDGYVVYRDTALFQIAADLVAEAREADRRRAVDAFGGDEALEAMANGGKGRGFYIMPPSFMVSTEYEHVAPDAPAAPVSLTITFMAPARWRDAASALGLPIDEYVRRRIAMESALMLISSDDGTFSPYELTTRKVD